MKHNFYTFLVFCFVLIHFVTAFKAKLRSRMHNKLKMKSQLRTEADSKFHPYGKDMMNFMVPGSGMGPDELERDNELDHMMSESEAELNAGTELDTKADIKADKDLGDLSDTKVVLENWLTISSPSFRNQKKFPILQTQENGYIDISLSTPNFQRINFFNFNLLPEKMRPPQKNLFYIPKKKKIVIPGQKPKISKEDQKEMKKDFFWFWFRASGRYMYYSSNPKLINQLGTFNLRNLVHVRNFKKSKHCFEVDDKQAVSYKICGIDETVKNKWMCYLERYIRMKPMDAVCLPKGSADNNNYRIKTIIQPLMLIPTASKHCHEKWDYNKNGRDWECKCKEGMEQSPINLPNTGKAIISRLAPLFQYEETAVTIDENTENENFRQGEKLKIAYEKGALRIKAPSFGKLVTLDGGVYKATEIIFNTPSNHRIEGKKFDMEMQVIHQGVSEGDMAKTVILVFLFKKKAGASNKFLSNLEVFNLPNPLETFRELSNPIFIPNVLLEEDEDELGTMVPFSFYTYQGSLQEPPCTERAIIYVASKPILTSHYSLQLMKEALRFPDQMDQYGNVKITNSIVNNNRAVQRQHGRAIFWYDSSMCNLMSKRKSDVAEKGHYEKVIKPARRYFFVEGQKPSGIPNAWVVTEKEALGESDLPVI